MSLDIPSYLFLSVEYRMTGFCSAFLHFAFYPHFGCFCDSPYILFFHFGGLFSFRFSCFTLVQISLLFC
jgi:hypothetical protein